MHGAGGRHHRDRLGKTRKEVGWCTDGGAGSLQLPRSFVGFKCLVSTTQAFPFVAMDEVLGQSRCVCAPPVAELPKTQPYHFSIFFQALLVIVRETLWVERECEARRKYDGSRPARSVCRVDRTIRAPHRTGNASEGLHQQQARSSHRSHRSKANNFGATILAASSRRCD